MSVERYAFALVLSVSMAGLGGQAPETAGERSIIFSGKVALDDGSAPPSPVMLRRVCSGRSYDAGYTDSDGAFSFQVDASKTTNDPTDASEGTGRPQPGLADGHLDPVDKSPDRRTTGLRTAGHPSGIPKRHDAVVQQRSPCAAHDSAPVVTCGHAGGQRDNGRRARSRKNCYQKALQAEKQQKWDDAARELAKAVKDYPKFALAWFELGMVRLNQHDLPGAAQAWNAAVDADPKYVKPLEKLTILSDQSGDWAALLKNSSAWIRLDPEDFPAAYLYNAIANARLNNADDAERAARVGLRIDKEGRVPRLRYVLGLILDQNALTPNQPSASGNT